MYNQEHYSPEFCLQQCQMLYKAAWCGQKIIHQAAMLKTSHRNFLHKPIVYGTELQLSGTETS